MTVTVEKYGKPFTVTGKFKGDRFSGGEYYQFIEDMQIFSESGDELHSLNSPAGFVEDIESLAMDQIRKDMDDADGDRRFDEYHESEDYGRRRP